MMKGKVVFELTNIGSKSEGVHPFLVTEDGKKVKLGLVGDNPFMHTTLKTYDQKDVALEGEFNDNGKFIATSIQEILPENKAVSDEKACSDEEQPCDEQQGLHKKGCFSEQPCPDAEKCCDKETCSDVEKCCDEETCPDDGKCCDEQECLGEQNCCDEESHSEEI